MNDKSSGTTIRRMLKFHNADVDLFGNTIFYPGMIVFIKPNFPGISKPFGGSGKVITENTIANTLGIGGYYVIIKVKSSIDPAGGFKTSINAVYEAGIS